MKQEILVFAIFLSCILSVSGFPADRKMLLFCSEVDGTDMPVLELKSTGEIVWTGQILNNGALSRGIGVSPDQKFVWTIYSDTTTPISVRQWIVTSFGQISTTGRIVSLSSTSQLSNIEFTPNGQMLLFSALSTPIFRAFIDGSIIDTGNIYYSGARLNLSPRGDIAFRRIPYVNNAFQIDSIDYNLYSVSSLQVVNVDGQPEHAIYTPFGDYLIYTKLGGNGDIDVWRILPNGMIDTTMVWTYEIGLFNWEFIDSTPNGAHFYVGIKIPYGIVQLDWFSNDTPLINKGIAAQLNSPRQMKVSPDGNYLVVSYDTNIAPYNQYIRTYVIQADGSLVYTGYDFPFEDTFGDRIEDMQFVYPPAPTSIPEELWLDPPPETELHSSHNLPLPQ